jgi:hypothetical protein
MPTSINCGSSVRCPDFGEALTMVIAIGGGITIFGLYMVNHSIRKARRLALKHDYVDRFTLSQNIYKLKIPSANLGFFLIYFYYQILTLFSGAIYIPSFT